MQRLPSLLLGLVALVAGGLALNFFFEARELRTELDALKRERLAQRSRIEEIEKARARLQAHAAAAASRATATEVKDETRTAQAGARPAGRPDANTTRGNFSPDNPQFQRLMAVQQKAGLDARYAPLFKKLGLSPGQVDQLKTLLVDKQMAAMDVMSAARAQGLTDRAQVRALATQAMSEVDNNIRSLIGADGLQQLQQYDRTAPQRALVEQLATRLSYTNSPLTPQQSEQLVQILADNAASAAGGPPGAVIGSHEGPVMRYATTISTSSTGPGPGPAGAGMFVSAAMGGPTVAITDQAVTQAQTVLSAEQMAALQQVRTEQQAQQQAATQMMQEAMKNQEPGQPGGIRQMVIQVGPGGPPPLPPPPPGGG